jgi:hypothetical protein
VEHEHVIYLSTSAKHPHPVYEDNAVIDWTFKTDWFVPTEKKYALQLKKSVDAVYHDFCIQLSGNPSMASKPIQDLIAYKKRTSALEKEITRLRSGIANSKQFNKKVELNLKLKAVEEQIKGLMD